MTANPPSDVEKPQPQVVVEDHGAVAALRLSHGVTNALTSELVDELARLARQAGRERRALLLAGGEKFFSIGLDLPRLLPLDRAELADFFERLSDLLALLHCLPIPTACAARGHAVAGGLTLLATVDFRFGASGRTLFGLNEVKLGLPVPYAVDLMLRQAVGDGAATRMQFGGEFIDAARAGEIGLLHGTFPKEEVEGRALEHLQELARLPQPALAAMKAVRTEEFSRLYAANGKRWNREFVACWFMPQTQELLREAAQKI